MRREFRTIDTWPWPFTPDRQRQRSRFDTAYVDTLDLLDRELRHVGASHAFLCLALPEGQIRQDRTGPLASARPFHPGVMVVTDSKHGDLRYATDTFTGWQDNLRAIALGLEALRKVDRYGITRGGEQYRGFAALSAPSSSESTHLTRDQALQVLYRASQAEDPRLLGVDRLIRLAKVNAHPDRHGGDHSPWNEVEAAVKVVDR